MKKLIVSLLCLACLLGAVACSKTEEKKDESEKDAAKTTQKVDETTTVEDNETEPAETDAPEHDHTHTEDVPVIEYEVVDTPASKVNKVVSEDDAAQYKAVFIDKNTSYDNTDFTKTGIFTVLYDKFYNVDRYYVWGYDNEEAKTGWQWEFTVADPTTLPKVGSEVTVAGKFTANESALDGKWIENANVTVVSEYNDALCKYDITTMSPTLAEQVQVFYFANNFDLFADDKIALYGEIGANLIINSVNDKSTEDGTKPMWSFHVETGTVLPEEGTPVTVVATLNNHGRLVIDTLYIEG
ncbi:MAG: hypothetical protein E7652_02515 [Ruminococcaceae bacterium]|nr:hypothetical protein [Oscillospiraceae bacterium]